MTTSNVSTAKGRVTGAAFVGGAKATLPTDASSALTGFSDLGFISEDGLTNSFSPSSEDIKSWDGAIISTPMSERPDTMSFKLMECLNLEALKLVFGDDNVSGSISEGITVKASTAELDSHSFVFDMAINGGIKRIVVPNGKVSSVGDISYKGSEATAFELELKCMPDANGYTHYEYIIAE